MMSSLIVKSKPSKQKYHFFSVAVAVTVFMIKTSYIFYVKRKCIQINSMYRKTKFWQFRNLKRPQLVATFSRVIPFSMILLLFFKSNKNLFGRTQFPLINKRHHSKAMNTKCVSCLGVGVGFERFVHFPIFIVINQLKMFHYQCLQYVCRVSFFFNRFKFSKWFRFVLYLIIKINFSLIPPIQCVKLS